MRKVPWTVVAMMGIATLAGCATQPAGPAESSGPPPAPSSSAPAQPTGSPVSFEGDLRTLIATAPPHRNVVPADGAPDGRADLNAMARLFSYPAPEPFAKRLGELGFRQGAVAGWELSQQSVVFVKLIQLGDEAAARQWTAEQRQRWQGLEQDTGLIKDLDLAADFDNGVQGGWYITTAVPAAEGGTPRGVHAVFYRHDIVVHIDLVSLNGDHVPAMASFADEQFARLP